MHFRQRHCVGWRALSFLPRFVLYILFLTTFGSILPGCAGTEPPCGRLPETLLEPALAALGQEKEGAARALNCPVGQWTQLEYNTLAPGDRRPPYLHETYLISRPESYMLVSLFNRRVYSITYAGVPLKGEAENAKWYNLPGWQYISDRLLDGCSQGDTVVRLGKDDAPVFSVTDKKIDREHDRWIRKFS